MNPVEAGYKVFASDTVFTVITFLKIVENNEIIHIINYDFPDKILVPE